MKFLDKFFGDADVKTIKKIQPIVDQINALENDIKALSDEQLKDKTKEFKERIKKGEKEDDILPEAFAVVREAAKRTLGQRHYDVQLIGGITLHRGMIAEMKTGEGKTLSATTAVYLNALSGKGVHVVTVNDYLARRDCDWMGRVYDFLGLSISCAQNQMVSYLFEPEAGKQNEEDEEIASFKVDMENLKPVSRKEAYQADITYGTNNEFGFDYLRDNMVQEAGQKVQRGLHYAIVDEIDSILIDEARTPLIISSPAEEATDQYQQFARIASTLKENTDYNLDEKMKATTLTDAGINKVEAALGMDNIYEAGGVQIVHHVEAALKAKAMFKKDVDYVVKEGEVIIVDEFTGRLMQGRRYSEGLHQAIEAKEGLDIKQESRTMATITFQNLFRLYDKLSGMTGTAVTEAEEFHKIYGLEVLVIPTNKPLIREDLTDSIYKNEAGKFKAVVKNIKEYHAKGLPVLVGTISIEKNELLGQLLSREGIEHNLLNAKNHEKEAEIIAQAGKKGGVTVATNMAGRGVDIILGGNPPDKGAAEDIKKNGGLVVIGTERHESRRIDNQLRGRSGRQGDPGITQFFVSMDDDLMRIFGSERMKSIMNTLKVPDDMPIENKMISRSIESAQKKVEGYHFDARKHVVEYDDVLNKHRDVIYKKRDNILDLKGKAVRKKIFELIENEIEAVVSLHTNLENEKDWDIKEIYETVNSIFPVPEDVRLDLKDLQAEGGDAQQDAAARTKIIEYIKDLAFKNYERMLEEVEDEEALVRVERSFILRSIDMLWVEHLDEMTYLREGIGLRGYAQKDPLIEYKGEAYQMFTALLENIQKNVVYSIFKIAAVKQMAPSPVQSQTHMYRAPAKNMQKKETQQAPQPKAKAKDESGNKVGRNDSCPCGSGKKYKKCHGQ
ncbi:preprotein translocase subunit SecA [Patescibacteria group bacterium]|nr:preprotein translocase subunit SecA [Patescibacteria group bacterium]MBU1673717.1 preprotein translocase subunit SecA [Patescibacteria group bacterium]MBU1963053.1 preprotein translocase subunit SecA [Patescibacteria group bacterium]